ncbi:MAG: hypothetical protein KKB21_04125, partial [Nanoarchaeota archaeon]|nr:hypothetical protein [Nanoarchaeota archaeon]
ELSDNSLVNGRVGITGNVVIDTDNLSVAGNNQTEDNNVNSNSLGLGGLDGGLSKSKSDETEDVEQGANETSEQVDEQIINASEPQASEQGGVGYVRVEVPYDAYDLDGDGKVDYIEWNVPHLSEQVYEIIYITKADLLDSDRNYIKDVYDYVKAKDNNWTTIPDGNYLRVTFEKNLTNKNDITIYARAGNISIDNQSVPYEVYAMKKRIDEIRGVLENG